MADSPAVPNTNPPSPDPAVQNFSQQLQANAKAVAETAIVLIGVAYLSGFLVVFTFQSRLGIHDANAEIFRIRYVQTGLLCLAFPLFLLIPITAHMWMYVHQRGHLAQYNLARKQGLIVGRSRLPYTLQLLCVCFCLFSFVLFEPYGEFHAHLLSVTLLLGLVVLPIAFFPKNLGFAATKERTLWRWGLAFSSLALLYFALAGTIHYLLFIFWKGRSYWIFMAALTYYVASAVGRKIFYWYPGQQGGAQLARLAILITLALLSVLSFAYRLYPYIPADKGGGNYRYSRDARLCVTPDGMLPAEVRDPKESGCTVTLKVLEITDTTVYVARSDDGGTDDLGQRPTEDHRQPAEIWSDGQYFPTIYALSRTKIAFLRYQLHTN